MNSPFDLGRGTEIKVNDDEKAYSKSKNNDEERWKKMKDNEEDCSKSEEGRISPGSSSSWARQGRRVRLQRRSEYSTLKWWWSWWPWKLYTFVVIAGIIIITTITKKIIEQHHHNHHCHHHHYDLHLKAGHKRSHHLTGVHWLLQRLASTSENFIMMTILMAILMSLGY